MGAVGLKTKTTDKAVRASLIQHIRSVNSDSMVLEEFGVAKGKARADVVMVDRSRLHAYEIKSDSDTLNRLPNQQHYYSQVFNMVTLVVGTEHVVKALYLIPNWWGVTVAMNSNNGIEMVVIREAKDNDNVSHDSVSEVMKKTELVKLLKQYAPGQSYSVWNRPKLVSEIKSRVDSSIIVKEFPEIIFTRACTV